MIRSKAILTHKHATFLAIVGGFCVLILPIWFSVISSHYTVFPNGCLLTLKCFSFNITSKFTGLRPGLDIG